MELIMNEDAEYKEDINTQKIKKIQEIIKVAESWSENQTIPQSATIISALKDIRRIAFK
jgi:hypothetical protein